MNPKNWQLSTDGSTIDSINPIKIPWLGNSVMVWFDVEEGQTWWTEKQAAVLDSFINFPLATMEDFLQAMETSTREHLHSGRAIPDHFDNLFNAIIWEGSHLCIPQLYTSTNQYAIFLPETRWRLAPDAEHPLELEILFTNGKIELVQEMSGLWTRIEWFSVYLMR